MMHRAWSSIVEVPYCFSRSYVKFQGHTALKIVEFDSNWAFPDCNSSLNSPMAMKFCTELETAKKRCPIVFQGHPSNFKVTWDKTSPILTQIGRFRTIGRCETIFWPPYILTPGSICRTIFWPRGQYIVTIFWPPSRYFDPPPNSIQNSFVGYGQLLNVVYCYIYMLFLNSERIGVDRSILTPGSSSDKFW